METAGREPLPARLRESLRWPRRRRRRRELLPYYAYRTGEAVMSALPRKVAVRLAESVATTIAVTRPRRFDGLRANLRVVAPGVEGRALEKLVRSNVRNLAWSWTEVLRMRKRGHEIDARLFPRNLERYLAAQARGRGVIAVSMHFGAWEMGLAGWNARGNQMALLAEQLQPPELFERIAGARGTNGVHVIAVDVGAIRNGDASTARRLGAAATREVYRVLKAGGTVAMALDRDVVGNGTPIEFFGRPASIPVGIIEIGIRTGAALVPMVLERHGERCEGVVYPEVHYDPDAPREQEVVRATREILSIFERLIAQRPDQWNVLEPVWSGGR